MTRFGLCAIVSFARVKILLTVGTMVSGDRHMKIAELLEAWRHHEHMSIREAAERVGISSSTYHRVEHGNPVQGETLAAILRWLLAE